VSKLFLLIAFSAVLCIDAGYALQSETPSITGFAGPYNIEVFTQPEKLEAAAANIQVTVLLDDKPVVEKAVWIELVGSQGVALSGAYVTNGAGAVPIQYRFERPGYYNLIVEVDSHQVDLPLQVHGQYILLFGFLAAIFVVVALLLDKM
jgi:hypothetical protein